MTLRVDLHHRRGSFSLQTAFEAPAAGVTALLGPSGAGKTTVLHAVAGLLRPEAGLVHLGERVLFDARRRIHVPAHRRRLACVFQDARLFPHLDVRANLLFGRPRAARRIDADRLLDELVALLDLDHLLARRPGTLSGGERQRVAIGRALLSEPELLLLDEPLTGLDAPRRREILACLERLRDQRGVPMLYVSHQLPEIARLADRVVLMEAGRVLRTGTTAEVLARVGDAALTPSPESVLFARVERRLRQWALTELACGGGTLTLAEDPGPAGTEVRLVVRAEDVMVAREPPTAISATNLLPGVVEAVEEADPPWADVTLACGNQRLVARITRHSAHRLGLRPGETVHAVIKAAILRR